MPDDEDEDPWEDKTAEITFGGHTASEVTKVPPDGSYIHSVRVKSLIRVLTVKGTV